MAKQISLFGIDILSYDRNPFRAIHFDVQYGTEKIIPQYSDRSLMLSWPDANCKGSFAHDVTYSLTIFNRIIRILVWKIYKKWLKFFDNFWIVLFFSNLSNALKQTLMKFTKSFVGKLEKVLGNFVNLLFGNFGFRKWASGISLKAPWQKRRG